MDQVTEVLKLLTGLPAITGPVLFVYLGISGINFALANAQAVDAWIQAHPRLAALFTALRVVGFDWKQAAERVKAALADKKRPEQTPRTE
jgi:hypothetical protein